MTSSTRKGRAAAAGVAGLCLLALGFLWMSRTSRRTPAGASPLPPPAEAPPPELEDELAATESARATTPAPELVTGAPPVYVPPTAPPPRPEPVLLTGAALRLDASGAVHASEDGSFLIAWRYGAEHVRREVEVRAGSWSTEVRPGALLHVRELVLGGVPITLDPDEFVLPDDRYLVLRGPGRRGVLLHVVSGDGSELEHVEVWNGPYAFPVAIRHPGGMPEGPPVLRDATSPVLVPPRVDSFRTQSQYFVRAPGHAWGTIDLDHAAGGERTLQLEAEGALEVELSGNPEWLEPVVRLWPPGTSRWAAYPCAVLEPDADDRAVFESLAPGTYVVSVERGWADRRISYGDATVELPAGKRLVVPLQVRPPEEPVPTTISGTLTVPLAWEREGLALVLNGEGATETWLEELRLPLADMRRLDDAPAACEAWAFEAELPLPGDFALEVFPLLVRRLLEVPAEGLTELAIDVPFPADVEVRVVDDRTGEEIPVPSVYWSTPAIEGILSTPLYPVVADPERGRPVFRAPAGPIRLSARNPALIDVEGEPRFELHPGPNELDYRVHRQIGVRFTFKDGEAEVPWSWDWRLSAHRVDGGARERSRSIGILWFLEEGVYELQTEGIPGYRSIDGTHIDVVRSDSHELQDVEIRLERE